MFVIALTGFTAASLGSPGTVEIDSDTDHFTDVDTAVILSFTANNFQSESVTIQPQDINHRINGEISEPIEIRISNSNTKAEYAVTDQGDQPVELPGFIYNEWDWGTIGFSAPSQSEREQEAQTWASRNCEDVYPGTISDFTYLYQEESYNLGTAVRGTVYCSTTESLEAQIGELQSTPDVIMETSFEVNGEQNEEVYVTSGQSEATGTATLEQFGTTIAKFDLQGGLSTGWNYPVPVNEKAAHSNDFTDNFVLIERQKYEGKYFDLMSEAQSRGILEEWHRDYDNKDIGQNQLNQYFANQINGDVLTTFTGSEFLDYNAEWENQGSDWTDGVLILDGDRQSLNAQFRVIVNADEVGYTFPVGEPVIRDVEYPDLIHEGDVTTVNVVVENIGDAPSDVQPVIEECSNEFTATGISHGDTVEPGETSSIPVDLTFASTSMEDSQIQGSCTVKLKDLQQNQIVESQSISLTGQQSSECTGRETGFTQPGENIVDGGTATGNKIGIYGCDDGLPGDLLEECSVDETVGSVNGELTCVAGDDTDTGGTGSSGLLDSVSNLIPGLPDVGSGDGSNQVLDTVHKAVSGTVAFLISVVTSRKLKSVLDNRTGQTTLETLGITAVTGILVFVLALGVTLQIPLLGYLVAGIVVALVTWFLSQVNALPGF